MLNHYEDIREDLWFDLTFERSGAVKSPDEEQISYPISISISRFLSDEDEIGERAEEDAVEVATIQCDFLPLASFGIFSSMDFFSLLDGESVEACQVASYLWKHYMGEIMISDLIPNILLVNKIELLDEYRGGSVEIGLIKDLAAIVGCTLSQSASVVSYFLEKADMNSVFKSDEQTAIVPQEDGFLPYVVYFAKE